MTDSAVGNPRLINVYVWYGSAMHLAATFESALVETLAILEASGQARKEGDELRDAIREHLHRPTGDLLARLRDEMSPDRQTEGVLRRGLEARNYLVHRFFRENSSAIETEVGCSAMEAAIRPAIVDLVNASMVVIAFQDMIAEWVNDAGSDALRRLFHRLRFLVGTLVGFSESQP